MKQLHSQPNLKEMLILAACYRPLSRLEQNKAARMNRPDFDSFQTELHLRLVSGENLQSLDTSKKKKKSTMSA